MVLSSPSARRPKGLEPADSVLREGELEACSSAKKECICMLNTLNRFRSAHEQAGLQQQSLRMVALYNSTMLHLDAAADGLLHIMSH